MMHTRTFRRLGFGWGMAMLLGVLLLTGVEGSAAAEAPREILIGATLPLSGRFTPMAGTFDRLCHSWAKQVNDRGGIEVKAYNKKLPVKFIISTIEQDRQNRPNSMNVWPLSTKCNCSSGPSAATSPRPR